MRQAGHRRVPRLHPHLLRHTYACWYLLAHRDPIALKTMPGHCWATMRITGKSSGPAPHSVHAARLSLGCHTALCHLRSEVARRPQWTWPRCCHIWMPSKSSAAGWGKHPGDRCRLASVRGMLSDLSGRLDCCAQPLRPHRHGRPHRESFGSAPRAGPALPLSQSGLPRTTFAENFAPLIRRYSCCTLMLQEVLDDIGVLVGGRPGTRFARRHGLLASRSTLIRLVRRLPLPHWPHYQPYSGRRFRDAPQPPLWHPGR
jgi:hypothetical protein